MRTKRMKTKQTVLYKILFMMGCLLLPEFVLANVAFDANKHIRLYGAGSDHKGKTLTVDPVTSNSIEWKLMNSDVYGYYDCMRNFKIYFREAGSNKDYLYVCNGGAHSTKDLYIEDQYKDVEISGYAERVGGATKSSDFRKNPGFGDLENTSYQYWSTLRWYLPADAPGKTYDVRVDYCWDRDCVGRCYRDGSIYYTITVKPFSTGITVSPEWKDGTFLNVDIKNGRTDGYVTGKTEVSVQYSNAKTDIKQFSGAASNVYSLQMLPNENVTLNTKVTFEREGNRYKMYQTLTDTRSVSGYELSPLKAYYDRCAGYIVLSWSASDKFPATKDTYIAVYRSNNKDFTSPVCITANGTERFSTGVFMDTEKMYASTDIGKTYYYRLYHNIGTKNGTADCEHDPYSEVEWTIRNPESDVPMVHVDSIKVKEGEGMGKFFLSWQKTLCSNEKLSLIRKNLQTNKSTVISLSADATSYTDEAPTCDLYTYCLEVEVIHPKSVVFRSRETEPVVATTSIQFAEPFQTSQGIYPDKVTTRWKIKALPADGTTFTILRREAGSSDNYQIIESGIKGMENVMMYEDRGANAGAYYEYALQAVFDCGGTRVTAALEQDVIGFVQPLATITGRVNFGTGDAVKDVSCMMYVKDAISKTMGWRSLLFSNYLTDGQTDGQKDASYATVCFKTRHPSVESGNEMTWQAWIAPIAKNWADDKRSVIYNQAGEYTLWMDGEKLCFGKGDDMTTPLLTADLQTSVSVSGLQYNHISLVVAADSLRFYLNGEQVASVKNESYDFGYIEEGIATLGNLQAEKALRSYGFLGWIDEVRLWNIALTQGEIMRDYGRTLSGKEAGLCAYWRMDEDLESDFYDSSYENANKYNENQGTLHNVTRSDVTPTENQFWLRGITDEKGNYQVCGIPYEGQGTTYSIVPVKGVHVFTPSERTVFIGANDATVINNVDFTDKSSFKVEGYVMYRDSSYLASTDLFPVEGVNIFIDGQSVMHEGGLAATDAQGHFSIDVPIGNHTISVKKDGHVFEKEGYYPAKGVTENYQADMTMPLRFYDVTRASLAGRIAGGKTESGRDVGFGESTNNVGHTEIYLYPEKKGYPLPGFIGGESVVYFGHRDKAASRITRYSDYYLIETDTLSGEFLSYLIPEKFTARPKVQGIEGLAENYFGDPQVALDLSKVTQYAPVQYWEDSVSVDGKRMFASDSLKCNVIQKFTHYEMPQIAVIDLGAKEGAFGDSIRFVSEKDSLYFYRMVEKSEEDSESVYKELEYTFHAPVFRTGQTYNFRIMANEVYTNMHNPSLETEVLVEGATLTIHNNLGLVEANADGSTVKGDALEIPLDSLPDGIYTFIAGFPNINRNASKAEDSYKLDFNLSLKTADGTVFNWRDEQEPLEAYVLGSLPKPGANFVTKGPDAVTAVLRDPPGSGSFATYTRNDATSVTFDISLTGGGGGGFGTDLEVGVKSNSSFGTGFLNTIAKIGETAKKNIKSEFVSDTSNGATLTTTKTATSTISTGSDDAHVGANGDLYIGYSSNINIAESNSINLFAIEQLEKGNSIGIEQNGWTIGRKEQDAMGIEFDTEFIYSQKQLLGEVIPDLREKRNRLLIAETDTVSFTNTGLYPLCVTPLKGDDPQFGEEGTYKWFNGSKVVAYIDSIGYYNGMIENWYLAIEDNEREKVEAIEGKKGITPKNISFDSGSTISQTTSKYHSSAYHGSTSFEYTFKVNITMIKEADVDAAYKSSKEKTMSLKVNPEFSASYDSSNTSTYQFTLKENNVFSYFSTDLYGFDDAVESEEKERKLKYSPVFFLRGGQSACPWEKPEHTMFYQPEKKHLLSSGTLQVEKPTISIKNADNTDVTNGEPVLLNVQLGNASEANLTRVYTLTLDSESKTYGADITLDGNPLNGGIDITVPAGQTITKQVKFSPNRIDSLHYENIGLIFHSPCQYFGKKSADGVASGEIFDEAFFSIHYRQSCSPLRMTSPRNNDVLNTSTGDKLTVRVDNYDLTYKNFKKIAVQTRLEGSNDWTTHAVYCIDEATLADETAQNKYLIEEKEFSYTIDMHDMMDGRYEVRVSSVCMASGIPVENTSDVVTIVKDMTTPKIISFEPSGGILTPDKQIVVTFNEPINQGELRPANVRLTGVLNGTKVANNCGLEFDGESSMAYTTDTLNLEDKDFTIELWLQRTAGNEEDVIITDTRLPFRIGYTVDDKLRIVSGGETYVSETSIVPPTDSQGTPAWQHMAVSCRNNGGNFLLSAFVSYDQTNLTVFDNLPITPSSGRSRIYLAKLPEETKGFKGRMRDFRIWSKVRIAADVYASQSVLLSGKEPGLNNYWLMDEMSGDVVQDKASSRHLQLECGRFVDPVGKSVRVLSTDDNPLAYACSTKGVFTPEDNFTIEFFFSADPSQQEQEPALFSAGKGDGTDVGTDNNRAGALSVRINKDEGLLLYSNGLKYRIDEDTDYFDGQWHHFALSVDRYGYANVLLDGVLRYHILGSEFGGMNNPYISLGSLCWVEALNSLHSSSKLNGRFDELRVWKGCRSAQLIKEFMHVKLSGDESGLDLYFPFERYDMDNQGRIVATNQSQDAEAQPKDVINYVVGKQVYIDPVYADVAPLIRDTRSVQEVNSEFIASDKQLVIVPTVDNKYIEKRNLTVSLHGIKDIYGNLMSGTQSWNVFVLNSRMGWMEKEVSLKKRLYEPQTVKLEIVNLSSSSQLFEMEGVPWWLTMDTDNGILDPLTKKIITCTIDPQLAIGTYNETIYLTNTENGMAEILKLNVKVYAEGPNWKVDPSLSKKTSMNILGDLRIDGELSIDPEDSIAAFQDGICISVAAPRPIGKNRNDYLVFMNLYTKDEIRQSPIVFKVWDASTGTVFSNVTPDNLSFVADGILGTASEPVHFVTHEEREQVITLNKGWTWTSLAVDPVDKRVGALFSYKDIEVLKGQDGQSLSDLGAESMTDPDYELAIEKMYKIKTEKDKALTISGRKIVPAEHPIQLRISNKLDYGWNWIGYTAVAPLSPQEAFAGADVREGEMVKGQEGFAVYYSELGWIGTLEVLQPGNGYLFKATKERTFYYPTTILNRIKSQATVHGKNLRNTHWKVDMYGYPNTMSMIAVVPELVPAAQDEIGVFVGDECRGVGVLREVEDKGSVFVIYIYGDLNGDKLTFRYFDSKEEKEIALEQTLSFVSDEMVGSFESPYILTVKDPMSIPDITSGIRIYPVPTKRYLKIHLEGTELKRLRLFDLNGQVLMHTDKLVDGQIDLIGLPEGHYLLELVTDNGRVIRRIIKK